MVHYKARGTYSREPSAILRDPTPSGVPHQPDAPFGAGCPGGLSTSDPARQGQHWWTSHQGHPAEDCGDGVGVLTILGAPPDGLAHGHGEGASHGRSSI